MFSSPACGPGALGRLGLDADTSSARYPSLIYARGHGFGVRGPDADQAGYDSSAFWARGGVAHILTPPERDYPISQRGAMGDRNGAMALAFGIAPRSSSDPEPVRGSVVDVSLLATAMWTLSSDLLAALKGTSRRADGWPGPTVNPLIGTYRTKDGRHIQLVFLAGRPVLAGILPADRPDELIDDPRFADLRRGAPTGRPVWPSSTPIFADRPWPSGRRCWPASTRRGRRCRPSQELLEDPQVAANGYVGEVSSTPR